MKNFLLMSLIVVFTSCDTRVVAQEYNDVRQVSHFSKIKVQQGIDVYLTRSDNESIKISTKGYRIEDIITEVSGNELHIYREGKSWNMGHIKVYLNYTELNAIDASGGSDVVTENPLVTEELYLKASGGSDMKLDIQASYLEGHTSGGSDLHMRGTTEVMNVTASGGSDIKANDLRSKRGIIKVSGGSDAEVFVSDEIDINASGGSDVNVSGNPRVKNLNNDRSSDVSIR